MFVCIVALFSGGAVPGLLSRDGSRGDARFGQGEEEEEADGFVRGWSFLRCHLGALGSRLSP